MASRQIKARHQKPRTFFDRKVLSYGYSRSLSMGKVLPKGWTYVRMEIKEKTPNSILVQITKLLGANNYAQTKKTNT